MERKHSKTLKEVLEIFEPYLTVEDILETLEELKEQETIMGKDLQLKTHD